jgi:hypothetical protein
VVEIRLHASADQFDEAAAVHVRRQGDRFGTVVSRRLQSGDDKLERPMRDLTHDLGPLVGAERAHGDHARSQDDRPAHRRGDTLVVPHPPHGTGHRQDVVDEHVFVVVPAQAEDLPAIAVPQMPDEIADVVRVDHHLVTPSCKLK